MKILNYEVINADTLDELSEAVEACLHDGWIPQGGICQLVTVHEEFNNSGERYSWNVSFYAQAMILPASGPEETK